MVVSLRSKHEAGDPLGGLPETLCKVPVAAREGAIKYEIRPHPELSQIVLEGAAHVRRAQRTSGGASHALATATRPKTRHSRARSISSACGS